MKNPKPASLLGGAVIATGTRILGNAVRNVIAEAVSQAVQRQIESMPKEVQKVIPTTTGEVVRDVLGQLEQNPTFVNQTNSERWYQSGVALGLTGATAGALGVVMPQIFDYGYHLSQYDWPVAAPALVTLVGSLYGYYRRFAPNLPPLFGKKS